MAENEAKARKKLEEAEKKAKGGGGFLGSLFGGSKADEAADLFVQEEGDAESQKSGSEIYCIEGGCGQIFDDIDTFEEHYELAHRHECAICGLKFADNHRMEVHSEEKHSSFFRAELELRPEVPHFCCWDSKCEKVFMNSYERNKHSFEKHGIGDVELKLEKRKKPIKIKERNLDAAMHDIEISPKDMRRHTTPRTIVFGDDQQQEQMFENKRLIKASCHWKTAANNDQKST